jgi:hypothetical protein
MKKWTDEEINFLINNYSIYGSEYCISYLNRSWSSVIGMATKLKLKAKKRNSLNIEEKEFLKINYPIYGCEYCMNALNRSKKTIQKSAHILKLKTNDGVKENNIRKKRRINNLEKYDVSNIITVKNKFSAYILGYLWSDGYIGRNNKHLTSISLVKEDAEFLFRILNDVCYGWTIGKEINKYWKNSNGEIKKAQNQRTIRIYSQELFDFLNKYDYGVKSNIGFNKIFSIISKEFKPFFILGLFDGDGHFNYQYRNNKYHSGEFVITASYDYDWSCLEKYFNNNEIEYSTYRLIVPLGRISNIIVRKKQSLIKLYNMIYCDEFRGLDRKYEKYQNYITKINNVDNDKY